MLGVLQLPPGKPDPIPLSRWNELLRKKRCLNQLRLRLNRLEAQWEAERDAILDALVEGAEIESDC